MFLILACGPFAVLDMPVFDGNWSELSQDGTPITPNYPMAEIRGYVDIMGFENTTVIDNVTYIDKNPNPVTHIHVECPFGHDYVESFTYSESVTIVNNNVSINVRANVNWADVRKTEDSTMVSGRHSILNFIDARSHPKIFAYPDSPNITIIQYINATTPHTLLQIPELSNESTAFTVSYNNSSISKYVQIGVIGTNNQNVEQVNYSEIGEWELIGDLCTHRSDTIIISEAPLNMSLLDVTISHPYGTVRCENISIQNVTTDPTMPIVEGGVPILAIFGIAVFLMGVSSYQLRRII